MKKRIYRAKAALIPLCLAAALSLAGCEIRPVTEQTEEVTVSQPEGIDYSLEENWAYYAVGEDKAADLFLIAPSVDTGDAFLMSLDDEKTKGKFLGALNMERGIYEENTRMYAPYYRQATLKVYGLDADEREQYMQEAYRDISDAFSYYLDNENDGRPIVLAGFSQGADMCYRLLEEYFGDKELEERLVAVYAIGWPCSREMAVKYPQIKPAQGETDTGVVISFDCEAPELEETFVTPKGSKNHTINPLNWRTDQTAAAKEENPGSCFTDYSGDIKSEVKGLCGCYIEEDRGILKVTDISAEEYPPILDLFPEGAYHLYDYQFFFRSLEENVRKRIEAFMGGPEYISEGDDSICEITGYREYPEDKRSYFLTKGDRVAVISPSALPGREQVDATVEGLKEWGFDPVEGQHVCQEIRTLDELLEDLKWALEDDTIKAIFCVRGGYGASEVMDIISEDMIRNAAKPIIGYSDITVYHSAWTSAGYPSIHACMSGAFTDLPDDCREAELQMMQGRIPAYRIESKEAGVDGSASGILIGGNLSTFTATLNTAYDCTQTDEPYILFIEEVGENIQHIHRYLTILKHMGVLDKADALIFGEWTELPADGSGNFGRVRGGKYESVADMIRREFLKDTDIPVAFGFPAGHGDVNYPLLMGEKLSLDVVGERYTMEWLE